MSTDALHGIHAFHCFASGNYTLITLSPQPTNLRALLVVHSKKIFKYLLLLGPVCVKSTHDDQKDFVPILLLPIVQW